MAEFRHSDSWGYPDAAEASLVVYTEAERAEWVGHSHEVVKHRGRFWRRTRPGVYEPIHLLATLTREELSRPTATCWAYRAALGAEHSGWANGYIPRPSCQ